MRRLAAALALTALLLPPSGCTWLNREKRIRERVTAPYAVEDPEFRVSAAALLGAPLVGGNAVTELVNGDRIFPAMLEAIRGARKTVDFEMYIFRGGDVGGRFMDALRERARAGVRVNLIVDAIGSAKLKRREIRAMEKDGVRVVRYNPPLLSFLHRANHRSHRKILVVDGLVGFTGGVCVNDEWSGNAEPGKWRDTMVRVEGPVVRQMQAVFEDNWEKERSEVLHGPEYFPVEEPRAGEAQAQFVASGPHEDVEKARLSFMLSIAAARKSVLISQAYFAPDPLMIEALKEAKARGVDLQIIVPLKGDNPIVQQQSMPRWRELVDAGVEIYQYQPTRYHPKIMIVDGVWSIVGSTNFDERSLKLNDEADIHVYDRETAAALTRSFERDKSVSRRLTLEDLRRRGVFKRLASAFLGMLGGQF